PAPAGLSHWTRRNDAMRRRRALSFTLHCVPRVMALTDAVARQAAFRRFSARKSALPETRLPISSATAKEGWLACPGSLTRRRLTSSRFSLAIRLLRSKVLLTCERKSQARRLSMNTRSQAIRSGLTRTVIPQLRHLGER